MAYCIEFEVRKQIWDIVATAEICKRSEPDMYRFYMGRLSGIGTMLVCAELEHEVFINLMQLINDTISL